MKACIIRKVVYRNSADKRPAWGFILAEREGVPPSQDLVARFCLLFSKISVYTYGNISESFCFLSFPACDTLIFGITGGD